MTIAPGTADLGFFQDSAGQNGLQLQGDTLLGRYGNYTAYSSFRLVDGTRHHVAIVSDKGANQTRLYRRWQLGRHRRLQRPWRQSDRLHRGQRDCGRGAVLNLHPIYRKHLHRDERTLRQEQSDDWPLAFGWEQSI